MVGGLLGGGRVVQSYFFMCMELSESELTKWFVYNNEKLSAQKI